MEKSQREQTIISPRKQRPTTMQEVAELAQVSKQTVSAVINNKPGITEGTRQRVLAVIEELGYRPDLTARSLRTGRTLTIALILTDVSSPVHGKMAVTVENYTYGAGYNLVLYNTHDDIEREQFYIDSIIQRSVDGALFISANDQTTGPHILKAAGIPVVVIDRVPPGYEGVTVVLDNAKAGYLAGEHLAQLGHRHIVHVGGPMNLEISRERLRGFCAALEAAGISRPVDIEPARDWQIESGYAAMQSLIHRGDRFTSVFAAGDLLAIGAMHAIREAGWGIPDKISMVSIDDIDLAKFHCPPMTTVSQSIAEMATQGIQLLLDLIQGKEVVQSQVLIEPRLIVRQSTAPLSQE